MPSLTAKGGDRSRIQVLFYGQLIAATAVSYVFFDELPDLTALLGAGLIVLAGLWLWRSAQLTRIGKTQ